MRSTRGFRVPVVLVALGVAVIAMPAGSAAAYPGGGGGNPCDGSEPWTLCGPDWDELESLLSEAEAAGEVGELDGYSYSSHGQSEWRAHDPDGTTWTYWVNPDGSWVMIDVHPDGTVTGNWQGPTGGSDSGGTDGGGSGDGDDSGESDSGE